MGHISCAGHTVQVDSYLPDEQPLRKLLENAMKIAHITGSPYLWKAITDLTNEVSQVMLNMANASPPVQPPVNQEDATFSAAAKAYVTGVISEMDKIYNAETWSLYLDVKGGPDAFRPNMLIDPAFKEQILETVLEGLRNALGDMHFQ